MRIRRNATNLKKSYSRLRSSIGLEHPAFNRRVAGSSPAGVITLADRLTGRTLDFESGNTGSNPVPPVIS